MNKRNEEKDPVIEKIKELYSNFGIDISNMTEEELLRIKKQYSKMPKGSLEKDLKRTSNNGDFEIIT